MFILLPVSAIAQIDPVSPYMVELTEPDSGQIECSEIDVAVIVGYRLFNLDLDDTLTASNPYTWAEGSPGYGPTEEEANEEPLRTRRYRNGVFRAHRGEDIAAPSGTPIITCYECELTHASENPGGWVERTKIMDGEEITITEWKGNHGHWKCYYIPALDISVFMSHLEDHNGTIGAVYQSGMLIGISGTSGRRPGITYNPHIHVEIRTGRITGDYPFGSGQTCPTPYLFGHSEHHLGEEVFLALTRDNDNADTFIVEENLDSRDVYSPSDDIWQRYKDPQINLTYEHTFDISSYPNGLMTASGAVCTTTTFPAGRDILAEDSRSCGKVCGNHAFIVQTGGSSTFEETYNYTDHWNSECRSPDYYRFYDFDTWGIQDIDHVEREADEITVEGAVFHTPWNKDKIQLIVVLSDQNVISDTIPSENIEQVSGTRTNWTYTFPANKQPYGFAVKMTYTSSNIGYWPKAKWARIKNARTFAYQKKLSSYGYITLHDCPAYVGYPSMWVCDSFAKYTKQMEQKQYQWAMDIDAQVMVGTGLNMALVNLCGRTEPQPPFNVMTKFVVSEPYVASRYGGFGCPDYLDIFGYYLTAYVSSCYNPAQDGCDIVYKATCDGSSFPMVPTGSYSLTCPPGFDFTEIAGEPPSPDITAEFCIDWGSQHSIAMALGAPESFAISASSGGSSRPITLPEETTPRKEPELPKEFALGAPRPNPFNTSVSFDIELPRTAIVDLRIYDILGNLVDVPIDGVEIPAGKITEKWTCANCPSGTYFIMMNANDYRETRKMTLVK